MRLSERKSWILNWLRQKRYRDFDRYDAYLVDSYLKAIGQKGTPKMLPNGALRSYRLLRDLCALAKDGHLVRVKVGQYIFLEGCLQDGRGLG